MNLGGVMVWTVETDDFKGLCHGQPFLLIKTISEAMNGPIVIPTTPVQTPTKEPSTPKTPTPSVGAVTEATTICESQTTTTVKYVNHSFLC